ncbi:MAG: hypothetical protein HYU64_07505 [Armatimonadetes bacterium]|nr:hypothetical protein [Armatimonadota bacterium]
MKALVVIHSGSGTLERAASSVAQGLRESGASVDRMTVNEKGEAGAGASLLTSYQIICVGSEAGGWLGSEVHSGIAAYLKQASGLGGKQSASFIIPGLLGGRKASRKLMAFLEAQGALVFDMEMIRNEQQASLFGRRLFEGSGRCMD